jgi:hypothetical protein
MRKGQRCSWVLAHTGHNETTATAASKAMKDFVRTVFKLG